MTKQHETSYALDKVLKLRAENAKSYDPVAFSEKARKHEKDLERVRQINLEQQGPAMLPKVDLQSENKALIEARRGMPSYAADPMIRQLMKDGELGPDR